ncbi:unnamed protein product [Allacma fusca]|uniref:Uncharacterized protein n=1 Tax=Allacma fusca TaxID=39272 RepID=A0A8J2LJ79_9HEXA|nr:unnamed protein product [Allacma fusca]
MNDQSRLPRYSITKKQNNELSLNLGSLDAQEDRGETTTEDGKRRRRDREEEVSPLVWMRWKEEQVDDDSFFHSSPTISSRP